MRLRALATASFALALSAPPAPAAEATPPAAPEPSFLEVAGPLLTAEERTIYLALGRDYRRRAFERRFWAGRDPFPETPVNELEARWRERMPAALERFGTLEDPRARVLLLVGEPTARLDLSCPGRLRPGEIWVYDSADRIREPFALVFLAAAADSGASLWSPTQGAGALAAPGTELRPDATPREWTAGCARAEDLLSALSLARDWEELARRHGVLPRPDPGLGAGVPDRHGRG